MTGTMCHAWFGHSSVRVSTTRGGARGHVPRDADGGRIPRHAGVFLKPYEDEFGWSPGLVGGGISISLLLYGGRAVRRRDRRAARHAARVQRRAGDRGDRLGPDAGDGRARGSTTCCGACWSASRRAPSRSRWRRSSRTTGRLPPRPRVGLLRHSSRPGSSIFLPLLAWLVEDYGWRTASAFVSALALFVVAPLAGVFIRDRPEQLRAARHSAPTEQTPPPHRPPRTRSGTPSTSSGRRPQARLLAAGGQRSSSAARPRTA